MTPTSQTPRHIIHAPFPLKKLGNSEDGRSIYVADKVGATLQTLQSAAEKPGAQALSCPNSTTGGRYPALCPCLWLRLP
jgi:hypothetical protein